jgi:glycosyltransferase involved in cell wall biosynthesis
MLQISIIVPIYNAEKYLRRCVDSILSQTFTSFECILVDDGSTDNSPQICDEYAARDSRIAVIHTENKGSSAARNTGLDYASGAWIGFVDIDDWCEPGMYQFLYDNAVKNDADVSVCEFRRIYEDSGNLYERNEAAQNENHKEILYDNQPDDAIDAMFFAPGINTTVWNKLIKSECIRRFHIRFDPAVQYCEDVLFVYSILKNVSRVFYSSSIYYNYLIRKTSKSGHPLLTSTDFFAFYYYIIADTQNKKLKRKIILLAENFVSETCYLEVKNYRDRGYSDFVRAAKKHLFAIFLLPLPLKMRLSRFFCVISPAIFYFLRKLYRTIKRRPQAVSLNP